MTQTDTQAKSIPTQLQEKGPFANTHYSILGLHPSASALEVRRAYRELSKKFHPDTTKLPEGQARAKFQRLNEAYAILSNPDRRSLYDLRIGYSRWNVIQSPQSNPYGNPTKANYTSHTSNSSYLQPTDRPLSPGELFALCLMAVTFSGCILVAVLIAYLRGETIL